LNVETLSGIRLLVGCSTVSLWQFIAQTFHITGYYILFVYYLECNRRTFEGVISK